LAGLTGDRKLNLTASAEGGTCQRLINFTFSNVEKWQKPTAIRVYFWLIWVDG
jgi:hypothetical protein